MANISKAHLFDKDIRNLKAKDKRYKVAVGSPKELYLFVHPSGTKTFFLRLSGDKVSSLKEFPPGYLFRSRSTQGCQRSFSSTSTRQGARRNLRQVE